MTGLVTVAVPTWNRAGYLADAVRSVLAQTYRDVEVLVGDNASTDETPAVVDALRAADPRVRAVRHPRNLGMVGNWQALLAEARGEYFLLLSDDDLLEPRMLESLVAPLSERAVSFTHCAARIIDGGGRVVFVRGQGPPRESGPAFVRAALALRRDAWPSALVARTADVRAVGYPDVGAATDLANRIGLALRGDVAFVAEPLVRYRVHAGAESRRIPAFIDSYLALREWARARPELAPYGADIDAWARRLTTRLLRGAWLRRDAECAAHAAAALRVLGTSSPRLGLERALFGNPVVRSAAELRRALRRRRGQALLP